MTESAPRTRLHPHAHPVREIALLFGLALALAGLSWAVRAPRLPLHADPSAYELDLGFPVVPVAEAVALYRDNACVPVDTRTGDPPRRIPGAFILRQETFDDDLREVFDFLSPADPLLICGDGNLLVASAVAGRLKERGFTHLSLLKDPLSAWERAGGELVGEVADGGGGHD